MTPAPSPQLPPPAMVDPLSQGIPNTREEPSIDSDSGRSKAARTPEAQEETKKACSHTFYREDGGWKVPPLKYKQR